MKIFFISFLLAMQISSNAQTSISQKDFLPIAGKWTGTLTYLDYTSNGTERIPANALIELTGDDSYDQYLYYSAEPDKNKKFRYTISADGRKLNDMTLMEKKRLGDGSLQLVLESNGEDGNENKPARFRHILIIGEKTFSITKMVKFEGEKEYFQRHRYEFGR
ncbi:MAG: hypothetical protein IPG86_09130 [Chitinophagaceae bacterium]|nr:hypothetical protein [Chitinophagaceae bacterium]